MIDLAPHTLHHISLSSYMTLNHTELEPGVQVEQAQAKDFTNLVWIKASPGAFNQYSLSFNLNLALCYSGL
jgi:hypothetical protein